MADAHKKMEKFTEELRSASNLNPIHLLQQKALELSGLTYDQAFAIDESDIGEKLGEFYITLLVEKFYGKVYSDKDEWFRSLFLSPKEENSQNLGDFLIQRIGGAPFYSDRKGFPALIQRHAMFNLSDEAAERWLKYMGESLDEMQDDIEDRYRQELADFLRYTAFFLVVAQKSQKIMESLGPGA